MHIKFLAHGTGSAAAAAQYLTGELDHDGRRRAEVEVLRGNLEQVAAVADALDFKHKYTSGVIAWSAQDNPTEAQIEQTLDEFERTAWAGLEPDRYSWSAVLHRDADGSCHVHVLAARCDLETGKSLNIAPPGWQKAFDPLRDALNHEHGWDRPDDPERARLHRPGPYRAYVDKAALRAGLDVEPDPRRVIGEYLTQAVERGTVRDRASLVTALHEVGLEVPRQGRNYVTALDPQSGQRWRLKGAMYARDFELGRPESANRKAAARGAGAERGAGGREEADTDHDGKPSAAAREVAGGGAAEVAARHRAGCCGSTSSARAAAQAPR